MIEFKREVPECAACCAPPAFRYALPEGTVLMTTQDPSTGQITQLRSSGSYGLCALCRDVVRSTALPDVAARRLATRVVDVHPGFAPLTPEQRKRSRKAAESIYARILPLLSDERPFVDDGKDPFDRTSAWFDGPATPPPPSVN